jgi:SAM-dependent methyltransferase
MVAKSPIAGYRCKSISESIIQPVFNLDFLFCDTCKMVCYKYAKDSETILDKLYSEHTATYYLNKQMNDYLLNFISDLVSQFKIGIQSSILEIGCNSGRLLALLKEKTHCSVIGVEPSKSFRELWMKLNLEVINDYFNSDTAKLLKIQKYDLIIFRHVFEHIPDPISFFKDVADLSDYGTTIVIEVPYFVQVLSQKRIDNISYSHLNYFTIKSISEIAKKFGMGIKSYKLVDSDGGSILLYIKKGIKTPDSILDNVERAEILDFIKYIKIAENRLKQVIRDYKKDEIVGYGAGAKGQHLIHILNLEENLSFVVDDTPGYENMIIPGTRIKIQKSDKLKNKLIKIILNLAPTHSETLRSKIPEGKKFIEVI